MYTCAACGKNSCETGKLDDAPKNCPGAEAGLDEIRKLYEDETNRKLAVNSALTEADGYCQKTRLEEIMDFADRCGFTKLGLAFCAGFKKEASVLTRVLTQTASRWIRRLQELRRPQGITGDRGRREGPFRHVRADVQPHRTGDFPEQGGDRAQSHPRPVRRTRLPVHQIFASAGHGLCREGQGPRAQPARRRLSGGRLLQGKAV